MKNEELIKKISPSYELVNGYTSVHYYDEELNILEIGSNHMRRNVLLYGKLVTFDISLNDVLCKINEISECGFENINRKYQVETISVIDNMNHDVHSAYIIY